MTFLARTFVSIALLAMSFINANASTKEKYSPSRDFQTWKLNRIVDKKNARILNSRRGGIELEDEWNSGRGYYPGEGVKSGKLREEKKNRQRSNAKETAGAFRRMLLLDIGDVESDQSQPNQTNPRNTSQKIRVRIEYIIWTGLTICVISAIALCQILKRAKSSKLKKVFELRNKFINERLPVTTWSETDESHECAICMESFEPGVEVSRSVPSLKKKVNDDICRHRYHTSCIKDWLLKSPDCPTCRKNFLGKKECKIFIAHAPSQEARYTIREDLNTSLETDRPTQPLEDQEMSIDEGSSTNIDGPINK